MKDAASQVSTSEVAAISSFLPIALRQKDRRHYRRSNWRVADFITVYTSALSCGLCSQGQGQGLGSGLGSGLGTGTGKGLGLGSGTGAGLGTGTEAREGAVWLISACLRKIQRSVAP